MARRAQPEGGARPGPGGGEAQVEQRVVLHNGGVGDERRSVLAGQGGAAEAEQAGYVRAGQAHRTEVTGTRGAEVGSAVIAAERVTPDGHMVGQERRPGRRR